MLRLKDVECLKTYDVDGYIAYYIPEHHLANKSGKVYEHMIAAEEMLGRKLNNGEVVHHKDKNRHNNSFDNLMVFKTISDHSAYHKGREAILDGDVYIALGKYKHNGNSLKNKCPNCDNYKDIHAALCIDCYNVERAKNIPSKEILEELLKNNSMCAIGRKFKVSDSAVRKWCRKYGLPFKRKDIKEYFEIN